MVEPIDSNTPQLQEATQLQFSLPMMFYITSVYAVGLSFGTWTIVFTTLALLYWWGVSRTLGCGSVLLMCFGFFAIISTLLPSSGHPIEYSRRTSCRNNIRQLTIAIINYEVQYMHFPAANFKDVVDKPIYSWRVAILPFIEQQTLYDQYNFDEPWDGPNNIKLLEQMPPVYGCPSHPEHRTQTPYKLVVDQDTAFENGRTISYGDIEDGSTNTICIVEDASNPVPWTKPEDLTIEQAIAALSPRDPRFVSHSYSSGSATWYDGSNISLLGGSTEFIGPTIDPEIVRSLCLIADGKAIDYNALGDPVVVIHRGRYVAQLVALIVYGCLLVLPGVFVLRQKWKEPILLDISEP